MGCKQCQQGRRKQRRCTEYCCWCLATAMRRVQQQRAAALDSGTAAHSNPTGRLGPQSAAYSEGMRWGSMRQPWPDTRIADLAGIAPVVGIGRSRGRGRV
jgi:hypothetical protein